MQKETLACRQEELRMFRIIDKIAAILNGYGSGKLFVSKSGKSRKKSGVIDLVSISDEARERYISDGDEANFRTDQTGRKKL
jgi:hypothetical protein